VLKRIIHTPASLSLKPNIGALSRIYKNVCFLDSNKDLNDNRYLTRDALLAVGGHREIVIHDHKYAFPLLQSFIEQNKGWMFGYLSYDLKNAVEDLYSKHYDGTGFPVIHFFCPDTVIEINRDQHIINYDDSFVSEEEALSIYKHAWCPEQQGITTAPVIKNRITREEYINSFSNLKKHILRGDIYEINFCQEFYAENALIDPAAVYKVLHLASAAPFSAYCKLNNHYILSSSPERFLKKDNQTLISQPIKGTVRRSSDLQEDLLLKEQLFNDDKERNENVMIVDLVRNDLSKIAEKGSVKVDELFGIYSFRQVHHMISTVSCTVKADLSFTDIIRAVFPMGSMTGAPKVRAMQLIEEAESSRRGVYSGALGYIDPSGNFDLSVVIRSILYNSVNKYLSFTTGSAITAKADAEQEYEECLLKAAAMFNALSATARNHN
jgi:para-aminobenzoate synthetase component 1